MIEDCIYPEIIIGNTYLIDTGCIKCNCKVFRFKSSIVIECVACNRVQVNFSIYSPSPISYIKI